MKKVWQFILNICNARMTCRQWCKFTVGITLTVVLGAALLAFVVDPHYRYREPFFYDTVYYEIYATAPHILRNQQYDLLMLGTSMTRNFFLDDINQVFGCDAVKLAASGGTAQDQCKFLDIAKSAKGDKLRRIIWSLDIYPLNKNYSHYRDFDYMYRPDHKEDYRYLFSRQTFSSMIYLIKRKTSPKRHRPHQSDRNRMFATDYAGKPYGKKEVIKDAIHNDRVHHSQTPFDARAHKDNFYGRVLPFIDRNPDVRFTIYLPPYHIYAYCQSEDYREAEALLRQREEVMLELLKRKNVELHDFQSDRKYVLDFSIFSDTQHFSNSAALAILEDLKNPPPAASFCRGNYCQHPGTPAAYP